MFYPIKFIPDYKEKVWGGDRFKDFREDFPSLTIGESWDISCHQSSPSVISNGAFSGRTLVSLIDEFGDRITGTELSSRGMDLLVKTIYSRENLSVQVHPDDEYAAEFEKQNGKNEFWYILDSEPGSSLILGTKDCDADKFSRLMDSPEIEKCLNYVSTQKDDVYFIPAGMVHAIGGGHLILEIQQSSDVTYRVYDYGRDRELHRKQAMEVIDFSLKAGKIESINEIKEGWTRKQYFRNRYFTLEEYDITGSLSDEVDPARYEIWSCIEGNGTVAPADSDEVNFGYGESIFFPAAMGSYRISGNARLLKTFVQKPE